MIFFFISAQLLCQLQRRVVDDLKGVLGVCTGNMKSTHQIRRLMRELSEDQIPEVWSGYYVTPPSQSKGWEYWIDV